MTDVQVVRDVFVARDALFARFLCGPFRVLFSPDLAELMSRKYSVAFGRPRSLKERLLEIAGVKEVRQSTAEQPLIEVEPL